MDESQTPPRSEGYLANADMSYSPLDLEKMCKIPLVEGFSPGFTKTLEDQWASDMNSLRTKSPDNTTDDVQDSPVIRCDKGILLDADDSASSAMAGGVLLASTPLVAPRANMFGMGKMVKTSLFGKTPQQKGNSTFEVKECSKLQMMNHIKSMSQTVAQLNENKENHPTDDDETFEITYAKENATFDLKNQTYEYPPNPGNGTFDMKNATFDKQKFLNVGPAPNSNATFDLHQQSANTTFSKPVSNINATFDLQTSRESNAIQNATFEKPPTLKVVAANSTFEVQDATTCKIGKVGNTTAVYKTSSKGSSSDSSVDGEMSVDVSSSSKCSVTSQQSMKQDVKVKTGRKLSKLAQPRMNAAARSRILAGSPVKSAPGEATTNVAITKPTQLQKPTQIAKKTGFKKTLPRKTLLPPPTTSNIKRPASSQATKSSLPKPNQSQQQPLATKRKAPESPKRTGRSAKFASERGDASSSTAKAQFKKPGLPAPTSSRSNSLLASSSRSTSAASSRSRLQKPGISTAGRTAAAKVTSNSTTSLRASQHNAAAKKLASQTAILQHNNKCALAMSTLLNYVVNELDGLSAPRLSQNNSQLEQLLKEKSDEYESLRENINQLTDKLNATTADLRSQRENYEQAIANVTQQHEETIEEMKSNHEQEIIQLQEKINDFEQNIDQKCEQRVQELVQPYLDAHAENESLRAVLEMKNKQIHDMQSMECKRTLQDDDIRTLQDKLDFVHHKNEDLSAQLRDKTNEYNELMRDCNELRHSVDDEQNRSLILHQKNEQLVYRLNSVSPSSTSFNPVFEASPNLPKNHCFSEFNDPFREAANHCDIENNNKI